MGLVESVSTQCVDCDRTIPKGCECNCMVGQLRKRIDVLESQVRSLQLALPRGVSNAIPAKLRPRTRPAAAKREP